MTPEITTYLQRKTFSPPLFTDDAHSNLGIVVAIPALAEPHIVDTLVSLKSCILPDVAVEVIVVINHSDQSRFDIIAHNEADFVELSNWAKKNSSDDLLFLISTPTVLPEKHAGAGLARKVAMDEAVRRLQNSKIENPIIVALDGDSTVSENYLVEIWKHFQSHPKSLGCSIHFEHPLDNDNPFVTSSIEQYELHLRYYQAGLAFANHPYAHFTIGSSMAVTRNAYVLQGGMNRRKAGEDFWFMLKLMMAGEISFLEEATVFPSDRESFRVPFGTGRAMMEMVEKGLPVFYTARFESFTRLKSFLEDIDSFWNGEYVISDSLTLAFLESVQWREEIDEIRKYTTDFASFKKRFYRWFNTFMVMKFFHFLRDQGELDVPVMDACTSIGKVLFSEDIVTVSPTQTLLKFRQKKRVKPEDFTL